MTKVTIEIEDTLDEIVSSAKLDLRTWAAENPDDTGPHDQIHEIADSAVPVYTREIDGLWYLYGREFETAYQNAGLGNGDEDNHQQVAIYCYVESELWDTWREIERDREDV